MAPKQKSVILDVDVGTNDAWAILLLLNNEIKANFKIKAITCVFGNSSVKNIGKNVLRVLETVDRLDVSISFHRTQNGTFIISYYTCTDPCVLRLL